MTVGIQQTHCFTVITYYTVVPLYEHNEHAHLLYAPFSYLLFSTPNL